MQWLGTLEPLWRMGICAAWKCRTSYSPPPREPSTNGDRIWWRNVSCHWFFDSERQSMFSLEVSSKIELQLCSQPRFSFFRSYSLLSQRGHHSNKPHATSPRLRFCFLGTQGKDPIPYRTVSPSPTLSITSGLLFFIVVILSRHSIWWEQWGRVYFLHPPHLTTAI